MFSFQSLTEEDLRLKEDAERRANWKRWGPYLAERQWSTVREDYSTDGNVWHYFPHDHARSRAYRWGEDGLLGICDREGRLCFALALWNGFDTILKERIFGLTGPEGLHGEDVKECYYYLDSTPTHSYMKALYKYPQSGFPYQLLVSENKNRSTDKPEFELIDSGIFDDNQYFDVFAEYAKNSPNDILIKITAFNRADTSATLHIAPTLWFANTWSWGCKTEGCFVKPKILLWQDGGLLTDHVTLGRFCFYVDAIDDGKTPPVFLFTENETNFKRLLGTDNFSSYVKDAFHNYIIQGDKAAVNPRNFGTKACAYFMKSIPAGESLTIRARLVSEEEKPKEIFGKSFERTFTLRLQEADEFFAQKNSPSLGEEEQRVKRQAFAGLLWSKQFYHYVVKEWIEGDPNQPAPPEVRLKGRNSDWKHLFNRDVISMPDKWEYPWYASWDLAFHMIPFSRIDPYFAREQLLLFLREWYLHPNGQIPAYEFALGDVNPPVHAWACWRVYKMSGPRGYRDRLFLKRVFHKLLINFTWWVNRKDPGGKHLFSGGFLGLDNIGVFDRSKPLPTGGNLEQADGTAWMAFYCITMLAIALELAGHDQEYEDVASKFFEHFVAIVDAMNSFGGTGLWHEADGFYYDQIRLGEKVLPLKVRSLVGLIPLIAVYALEREVIDVLPGFKKRLDWFLANRPDLGKHVSPMQVVDKEGHERRLLSIASREQLTRLLRYMLDETEFLSPHGMRSLSKVHKEQPFEFFVDGEKSTVEYLPGESTSRIFGGNSNWRGPVWFPVNFLIIEALQRYHYFYGESLLVECPAGSGKMLNLRDVAHELAARMTKLFVPDKSGRRPVHGDDRRYADDPAWRDLVLFFEFFHGDTGRGLGAAHQTGWTALVAEYLR